MGNWQSFLDRSTPRCNALSLQNLSYTTQQSELPFLVPMVTYACSLQTPHVMTDFSGHEVVEGYEIL